MKKFLFLALLVLFLSSPSFATNEFYRVSRSIRSMGMGGAFYSLSDDEYALFSNPAGLSLRRSGTEVMLQVKGEGSSSAFDALSGPGDLKNLKKTIEQLDKYKNKPIYGNAGILPFFLTRNIAVGVILADAKMNFNVTKTAAEIKNLNDLDNDLDNVADITFLNDSGLVIGYAQEVGVPGLNVGANLKGLYRFGGNHRFSKADFDSTTTQIKIDPKELGGSGLGIDLDLGAIYELNNLPFGIVSRASLVLSNLLASQFSISKKYAGAPGLVRTLNLGWMTSFPGNTVIDNVHVLFDISDIPLGGEDDKDLGARTSGSLFKKTHLGIEVPIGVIALRAGLNQGYLSAGIGFNLYAVKLNFATYGEDTGDSSRQQSRRYALSLAVGWGAAPAAPITQTVPIDYKPEPPKPMPKTEPISETNSGLNPEPSKSMIQSKEVKEPKTQQKKR